MSQNMRPDRLRNRQVYRRKNLIRKICFIACAVVFVAALAALAWHFIKAELDRRALLAELEALNKMKEEALETEPETETIRIAPESYDILPEYQELYEENNDMIGWLKIEDTVIDYPVMQTLWDEEYYLYLDFYGNYNINGCLLMDTDSEVGIGTAEYDYENGVKPSTNLIIHGHNMNDGSMFGNLQLYENEEYGKEHSVICFDSLYEHREYTLISAFFSQVYYVTDDVFKYYKFFEAGTEEEFNDWYGNIKSLSEYDTGVSAEFGDEFITLSTCAYHVDDGRFVVVGVRTK